LGPARRAAARALLAVGALVVAAVVLQPFWLAPLVGRALSASSGRSVRFVSMWLGLASSLAPVVQFRGIRIDNAAWADSRRPYATLDAAAAVVSWRSVAERRPIIALLLLRDGQVDLERRADGLRNWRLSNPDDRGPGRYKVLTVKADRTTVRFVHGGIDLDLEATASANRDARGGADPPLPTRIDLRGEWRGLRFAASVATGELLTFLETGRTFPLRGHLEAGGARLDAAGDVGDIVREPLIDARVALAGSSLAPFAAFVDARHREAKAVRIEGALKAGGGSYALSAAKARIGATDLAGELSWTHREPRSVVRAQLASDSTDLADLRWLAGVAPVPAHDATSAPARPAKAVDFSTARQVDGELSFATRRLHAAGLPWLQSGQVDAALADGYLTVSRFDLGIAHGHATGRATIDVREPPLRADADLSVRGIRVEQLAPEQSEKSRVTGALQGRAQLTASGASAAALLASAAGSVTATLAGGTISSLLDAEIGLQGGKILRSLIGGVEPIAIRCAAAAIDIAHGTGQVRTLVLDSERTRTTGAGTIDLANATIDLVLTPEAKQGGLFILDRSIQLSGPLRHPIRELVARRPAGGAAAKGCPAERP
jgi:uncharacterized protein involved in outer membrane biogenesis